MVLNAKVMTMEGDVCGCCQRQVTKVDFELTSQPVIDEKSQSDPTSNIDFWTRVDNPSGENRYEERRLVEKIGFEDEEMAAAKVLLDLGRMHTRKETKEEDSSEDEISPLHSSLWHSVPSLPTLHKHSPPRKHSPPLRRSPPLKHSPPPPTYYNHHISLATQPLFLSTPDVHAFATAEPVRRFYDDAFHSAFHYRPPELRAHSCHNIFAQTDPLQASVSVNKVSLDRDYYLPRFSIGTQTEEIEQPLDLRISHLTHNSRKPRSQSLSLEPSMRLTPYSRPHNRHLDGVAPPCSELVRCRLENQILRHRIKSLEEKLKNVVK